MRKSIYWKSNDLPEREVKTSIILKSNTYFMFNGIISDNKYNRVNALIRNILDL
jgi:hypothetical protein